MLVTEFTRSALRHRRSRKELAADGFIEIGEGGGDLWKLYRGGWQHRHITDVVIGHDRKSVWVKLSAE